MKNRVLLVRDEHEGTLGLRTALTSMDAEWETALVENGRSALDHLEANPCDIVVTSSRIADMLGTDLLDRVKERFPTTVRMLVSQKSDWDSDLQSPGSVDQILSHRADSCEFRRAMERATRLRTLTDDPRLRRIVEQVRVLPSLPSLYMQVVDEMNSEDPSIGRVGEIVSHDVAMSAKILQLVNSPAFGTRNRISNPAQATVFLGLDLIKGLVLTVKLFDRIREHSLPSFPFEELWEHSFRVGSYARLIAKDAGCSRVELDLCFTSGLLHDLGKLIFVSNLAESYLNVHEIATSNEIPLHVIERETFGTTHAELGAYLMGLWGLDQEIFDAVLFHHGPVELDDAPFLPVDAVFVANAIDRTAGDDEPDDAVMEPVIEHLERRGFAGALGPWRRMCLEVRDGVS